MHILLAGSCISCNNYVYNMYCLLSIIDLSIYYALELSRIKVYAIIHEYMALHEKQNGCDKKQNGYSRKQNG